MVSTARASGLVVAISFATAMGSAPADGAVGYRRMGGLWPVCWVDAAEGVTCLTDAVVLPVAVVVAAVVQHAADEDCPSGPAAVSYACSCNAASEAAAGLQ